MTQDVRITAASRRRTRFTARLVATPAVMTVLAPLVLLLAWEVCARAGVLDRRFFPAPTSVVAEGFTLAASGVLLDSVGWTLSRVFIGFACGAVPAVVLGLVLGLSPLLNALLRPVIGAIYPIPKVALFPLIMLIFGLGETSKYVIVAVAVFFQVFFSTLAGVMNVERIYLDVAANFGATRWQAYRTIAFPAALPFIFTGIQLGLGMALIVVVVAEQFGTKIGLGYMIWRSWQIFEVRDMFVALVVIALLGYAMQVGVLALERRVVAWKPKVAARHL